MIITIPAEKLHEIFDNFKKNYKKQAISEQLKPLVKLVKNLIENNQSLEINTGLDDILSTIAAYLETNSGRTFALDDFIFDLLSGGKTATKNYLQYELTFSDSSGNINSLFDNIFNHPIYKQVFEALEILDTSPCHVEFHQYLFAIKNAHYQDNGSLEDYQQKMQCFIDRYQTLFEIGFFNKLNKTPLYENQIATVMNPENDYIATCLEIAEAIITVSPRANNPAALHPRILILLLFSDHPENLYSSLKSLLEQNKKAELKHIVATKVAETFNGKKVNLSPLLIMPANLKLLSETYSNRAPSSSQIYNQINEVAPSTTTSMGLSDNSQEISINPAIALNCMRILLEGTMNNVEELFFSYVLLSDNGERHQAFLDYSALYEDTYRPEENIYNIVVGPEKIGVFLKIKNIEQRSALFDALTKFNRQFQLISAKKQILNATIDIIRDNSETENNNLNHKNIDQLIQIINIVTNTLKKEEKKNKQNKKNKKNRARLNALKNWLESNRMFSATAHLAPLLQALQALQIAEHTPAFRLHMLLEYFITLRSKTDEYVDQAASLFHLAQLLVYIDEYEIRETLLSYADSMSQEVIAEQLGDYAGDIIRIIHALESRETDKPHFDEIAIILTKICTITLSPVAEQYFTFGNVSYLYKLATESDFKNFCLATNQRPSKEAKPYLALPGFVIPFKELKIIHKHYMAEIIRKTPLGRKLSPSIRGLYLRVASAVELKKDLLINPLLEFEQLFLPALQAAAPASHKNSLADAAFAYEVLTYGIKHSTELAVFEFLFPEKNITYKDYCNFFKDKHRTKLLCDAFYDLQGTVREQNGPENNLKIAMKFLFTQLHKVDEQKFLRNKENYHHLIAIGYDIDVSKLLKDADVIVDQLDKLIGHAKKNHPEIPLHLSRYVHALEHNLLKKMAEKYQNPTAVEFESVCDFEALKSEILSYRSHRLPQDQQQKSSFFSRKTKLITPNNPRKLFNQIQEQFSPNILQQYNHFLLKQSISECEYISGALLTLRDKGRQHLHNLEAQIKHFKTMANYIFPENEEIQDIHTPFEKASCLLEILHNSEETEEKIYFHNPNELIDKIEENLNKAKKTPVSKEVKEENAVKVIKHFRNNSNTSFQDVTEISRQVGATVDDRYMPVSDVGYGL